MEKDKALDALPSVRLNALSAKAQIMRLGQNTNIDIEAISTGSLGIDIALGIGGMPTKAVSLKSMARKALVKPHSGFERYCSSPEKRRHLRFY